MATVRKRTWKTAKGQTKQAWLVDYRDQAGDRRFETFDNQQDAKSRLREIENEIDRGSHTANSVSITVAEAGEVWIKRGTTEGLEKSTLREYKAHAERYINPVLGTTKLAKLTTPTIEDFRDDLLSKTSRPMAKKVLTSLKGLLAEAQRRGLVAQNVASPVKIEIRARHKTKLQTGKDIPSKAEIQKLLAAAEGTWRPFFITAIFTGLRASELRGLIWDNVDFASKVIHVRQRANLWGDIGSPKSLAGNRQVPMSPMVLNVLKEHKISCGQSPFVFPNPKTGLVDSHTNASRSFYALQRTALGTVKYGLHSLRHFCASWLIEQGFPPKRVQEWLGHSSFQMTYDVYGHLFPNPESDQAKLAAGELSLFGT